ncbi:MAG: ATP-binding cassette domain-containing protein [Ferruginibacter sp.]
MHVLIDKLSPTFLEKEKILSSGCWNKTLHFEAAERIHIVAPSGRGKTSLIHFLYGMRKDYTGSILFDNKDVKEMNAESLATLRSHQLSIIFQDLKLFPQHTVKENIEVKRNLAPYYNAKSIEEMATILGIASKLSKPVSTCSYGEQQRIAIIRSLQQPFDFLVMDEPFSHLDEANRHKAMELIIDEASKRNASLLLADLEQRDYFKADKIIAL